MNAMDKAKMYYGNADGRVGSSQQQPSVTKEERKPIGRRARRVLLGGLVLLLAAAVSVGVALAAGRTRKKTKRPAARARTDDDSTATRPFPSAPSGSDDPSPSMGEGLVSDEGDSTIANAPSGSASPANDVWDTSPPPTGRPAPSGANDADAIRGSTNGSVAYETTPPPTSAGPTARRPSGSPPPPTDGPSRTPVAAGAIEGPLAFAMSPPTTSYPKTQQPSRSPSTRPPVTPPPTRRPVTSLPTRWPTRPPFTVAPGPRPTSHPSTRQPTRQPTTAPVTSPPTRRPVTSSPMRWPARSPVASALSPPPTSRPTTRQPTSHPAPVTSTPTRRPVTAPPTRWPTMPPVTPAPSPRPTSHPTTRQPTRRPTAAPVTSPPTGRPIASLPTRWPTRRPVTPAPSPRPTSGPSTRQPTERPTARRYLLRIELQTDAFGDETSWTLHAVRPQTNAVAALIRSVEVNTYQPHERDSVEVRLAAGKYRFTLKDAYGDGFCCGNGGDGWYVLSLDGREVVRGRRYRHEVSHDVLVGHDPDASERDREWLDAHNVRREEWHGRHGTSYVPLRWSETLAAGASAWADELLDDCDVHGVRHSDADEGENLAKNRGRDGFMGRLYPADDILSRWVEDEATLGWPGNGHLTQVLWRASKYVGCGDAARHNDDGTVCRVQVCRYVRAGNCAMRSYDAEEGDNWLVPMLLDDTNCGPRCPDEGCY